MDIIDGTPLLDIKPYVPRFDIREEVKFGWLEKVRQKDRDKEIARARIIGELDAINLYKQMAAYTQNATLKKIPLDIVGEEKTYMGEFQKLLLKIDTEQVEELRKGKEEVEELTEG